MVTQRKSNTQVNYNPSLIGLLGRVNTWTANQTFASGTLRVRNPAATFVYSIEGAAIVADRIITLPLLTAGDTLAVLGLAQTFTAKLTLTSDLQVNGIIYGNETANSFMTKGLTLNMGAATNEIVDLKSSTVAHGITDVVETDTFVAISKAAAGGGAFLRGFTGGTVGLLLSGTGVTDDTTKATTSTGYTQIRATKKSVATDGAVGANANLLTIQDVSTTRFILDADGDSHQDVGTAWTNFDDYDDAALLTALAASVSKRHDPIRHHFGTFLRDYRPTLEKIKLVSFNDGPDGDGHPFVNMSKLTMLLVGAIRQLTSRLASIETENQRPPPVLQTGEA